MLISGAGFNPWLHWTEREINWLFFLIWLRDGGIWAGEEDRA